jgi:hypothetical protein
VDDYYHTSNSNLDYAGKVKDIDRCDLAVDSLEFARRFAKAFRRAVEVCDGKPSTF